MGEPTKKSAEMESFLDELSQQAFGRLRTESIKSDVCSFCGGDAAEFKDALSEKEYAISGFCQKCQDETFDQIFHLIGKGGCK